MDKKLIAEADQGERPRLDFVEFIPKHQGVRCFCRKEDGYE